MSEDDRGRLSVPTDAFRALRDDDAAPTAVEYALMLGGVALAVVTMVAALGSRVNELFNSLVARWP
jgi:Flp pilus assembly pilin Flp